METIKQDNLPNEEALIQTAKDFLANKQYDELLAWVNDLLETGEQDCYYRMRALAKVYRSYEDPGDESELLTAFEDIEKALALSYSESNLRIKHWILGSAIDYYHNSRLFLPLFEYTVDHTQDKLLVRDSSIDGKDYISKLPFGIYLIDHKENHRERIQILDELIELTGKPEYYEKRALDKKGQNDLLTALEDINKSIELEPTAQRYMLRADIEIASNNLEDALVSFDLAYEHGASQVEYLKKKLSIYKQLHRYDDALIVLDDLLRIDAQSEKYLNEKYRILEAMERNTEALAIMNDLPSIDAETGELLYQKFQMLYNLKRYPEALSVLDEIIAVSPPDMVNPDDFFVSQISNSYAWKLDVMLRMEDYDAYSRLIKSFLIKKLDLSLIYYLRILVKKQQYHVILNHFQSEQDKYPVIKWFVICALIKLDEKTKASHLIRQLNSEEVYKATTGLYNFWTEPDGNGFFQVLEDTSIALLCESLGLRNMSFLLFVELIVSVINKPYDNSSPDIDSVGSTIDDISPEIILADVHPGDADLSDSQEVLASYHYGEYDFWHLPDVEPIISDMKAEPSYLDGTDRLMPELRAKQRLVRGLRKEEFHHGTYEILLGIERELVRLIDVHNIQKINDAKEEERNRILASLSHSIKNTLRSIIDPLIVLKREIPQKERLISDAIKGAGLIREMVTAINASTDAKLEDTLWDIEHQDEESMSLREMINHSLTVSLSNMFDSRNYAPQHRNYFPRRLTNGEYADIRSEWEAAVSTVSIQPVLDFAANHMAQITLDLSEAADNVIGNTKGSAIKLLILFQEIIFNAVKYGSDVERGKRFIEITLVRTNDRLIFKVSNCYKAGRLPKSTGMGMILIDNFAKVLATKPDVEKTDSVYTISLEFEDLWRKNGQEN